LPGTIPGGEKIFKTSKMVQAILSLSPYSESMGKLSYPSIRAVGLNASKLRTMSGFAALLLAFA